MGIWKTRCSNTFQGQQPNPLVTIALIRNQLRAHEKTKNRFILNRHPTLAQRDNLHLEILEPKNTINIYLVINREQNNAGLILTTLDIKHLVTGTTGIYCRTTNSGKASSVGVIAALQMAKKNKWKGVILEIEDGETRRQLNKIKLMEKGATENPLLVSAKNLIYYFNSLICKPPKRPIRSNLRDLANNFLSYPTMGESWKHLMPENTNMSLLYAKWDTFRLT